jgi:hypothetical protein
LFPSLEKASLGPHVLHEDVPSSRRARRPRRPAGAPRPCASARTPSWCRATTPPRRRRCPPEPRPSSGTTRRRWSSSAAGTRNAAPQRPRRPPPPGRASSWPSNVYFSTDPTNLRSPGQEQQRLREQRRSRGRRRGAPDLTVQQGKGGNKEHGWF